MRVAIIIPALNEASTIGPLVEECHVYGDPIIIDDGSTDETARVACQAGAITVLSHGHNRGYDQALRTGFRWAHAHGYDVVCSFDADAQFAPSILESILAPLHDHRVKLVLGVRPHGARVAERLFSAYTMRRFHVPDILCGVKAFDMEVITCFGTALAHPSIGTALTLKALRAGSSPVLVPVQPVPRQDLSRFGAGLQPNLRILRALLLAIFADLFYPLSHRADKSVSTSGQKP